MTDDRGYKTGIISMLGCDVLWGVLPLYWQALRPIDSWVIIFYRIFLVGLVAGIASLWIYGLPAIREQLKVRSNLWKFPLAGCLITCNWSIYIWAVNADHVIQTCVGYYIEPLIVCLLGILIFREKVTRYKLIAMLSYRIALKTRMCPEQAALCFCCALVADAGMLDLPRQLFFREILTGRERKLLRDQCRAFIYQLDFVPSGYLQFFVETCSCRKENMDGSGYPEGLKGGDIPVLARIVRAAEDYTAMTERKARKYLVPLSSRAAVREMRKSAELYDQRIVNIIEKLV